MLMPLCPLCYVYVFYADMFYAFRFSCLFSLQAVAFRQYYHFHFLSVFIRFSSFSAFLLIAFQYDIVYRHMQADSSSEAEGR